ncbi:GFA family protein [Hahella ganghwensis]|uniref:GFA family protein n=1 Tax=Hahella ganghwensis TaxID=286420 RepID=UPI000477E804|nr:GFA family protein [Hahella ganghwensis]
MDKLTGSCLCGGIRYEIDGSLESFYLCHCHRCRKDTGSAHAANLFSTTATLNWLIGEGQITTYTIPSTRHSRSFCRVCGSAVPGAQMDGKLLVVPAGSLDSEVPIKPDAHLFISEKANWDSHLEGGPAFDTLPS